MALIACDVGLYIPVFPTVLHSVVAHDQCKLPSYSVLSVSRLRSPYDKFSVISRLAHHDFILHHISNDVIEHDILIFIQYKFERIKKERGLLSDWPEAKDINSLVQDANGLFIYAATICRFIDRRHPKK